MNELFQAQEKMNICKSAVATLWMLVVNVFKRYSPQDCLSKIASICYAHSRFCNAHHKQTTSWQQQQKASMAYFYDMSSSTEATLRSNSVAKSLFFVCTRK